MRLPRLRAGIAGGLVLGLVVAIVAMALTADGRDVLRATSHDGGAWLVDHPNDAVRHIEATTRQATATIDASTEEDVSIRQSGATVLKHDRASGRAGFINPVSAREEVSFTVPPRAQLWATPSGTAIHERSRNRAFVMTKTDAAQFEFEDFENASDDERFEGLLFDGVAELVVTDTGTVVWRARDRVVIGTTDVRMLSENAVAPNEPVHLTTSGELPILVSGGAWYTVGADRTRRIADNMPALLVSSPTAASAFTAFIDTTGHAKVLDLRTGETTDRGLVDGEVTDLIWFADCVEMVVQRTSLEAERRCGDNEPIARPLDAREAELRLVNGQVWIDADGAVDYVMDESDWLTISPGAAPTPVQTPETTPTVDDTPEQGSADEATDTVPCNDPDGANENDPVASADDAPTSADGGPPTQFATRIGRPIVADVLRNDFDRDCDVLLIEDVRLLSGDADVRVAPDQRSVSVIPSGSAQRIEFEYTISDGTGRQASTTAAVSVLADDAGGNNPPAPRLDRLIGATGSVVRVNVLANDTDPDGDPLHLRSVGPSSEGPDVEILASHSAGEVLLALPDLDDAGDRVRVPYEVEDRYGATAQGEIEITVRIEGSNRAPDARNDSVVTRSGQPATINLTANDVDGDNDRLRVLQNARLLKTPADAADPVFSTSAAGELSFEASTAGTYLLEYDASDGTASDTAKVRIEVDEIATNRPPVALRDDTVVQLGESRLVRVLANDGDPDGDVVGISFLEANDDLDVQVIDSTTLLVTLGPRADRIETFRYRISDGNAESDPALVVVTRSDAPFVDGPPIAVDDTVRVRAGRTSIVRVLPNDFDPEGGIVRLADSDGSPVLVQGAAAIADGVTARVVGDQRFVSVRLEDDVDRLPFSFNYSIVDDVNPDARAAAVVRVSIVGPDEPNTPPLARADRAVVLVGTQIDISVLDNDTDAESDPISLTGALPQAPTRGAVEFGDDGTLRYTATDDAGTDRFTYQVRDSEGSTSVGLVEVGVLRPAAQNNDPVAADDTTVEMVAGSGEQFIDVLRNDTDFDGDPLRVIDVIGSEGAIENVSIDPSGNGLLFQVPELLSSETTVGFGYRIADGRGGTDEAQVIVVVLPNTEDLPPVAVADQAGPARPGTTVLVDVLANDVDPDSVPEFDDDGQRLDLQVVDPELGTSIVTETRPFPGERDDVVVELLEITIPDESGEIPYTIRDADGLTSRSFVTVQVEENLPPQVQGSIIVPQGPDPHPNSEALRIDLAEFATDPDGDELLFYISGAGVSVSGGTAQILDNSSTVEFIAFDDALEGRIPFVVVDEAGNEVAGTVTVILEGPTNEPPIALEAVRIEVEAGVDQPLDLRTFFEDPDGDELTITIIQSPSEPVSIVGDPSTGTIELVVDKTAGQQEVELTIQASDGEDAVEATISISVMPNSSDPPIAQSDSATMNQGESLTVSVLDNDVDLFGEDGLIVTEALVAEAAFGVATTNGQVVTFTPDSAFFGTATIRYVVQDGRRTIAGQAEGLLTVQVIGQPSPPVQVAAEEAGPTNVTLTWRAPADNGAPIESYTVEILEVGQDARSQVLPGIDPQAAFDDLTAGSTYQFRVAATNSAGQGEFSELSNAVLPDAAPAAPGPPVVSIATAEAGQLQVSWNEPANSGSPITAYMVQQNCGGDSTNTQVIETTLLAQGVNGVRCTFRVHAVNGAIERGADPIWSTDSEPECPVGVPGAPVPPQAQRGNASALVSWVAPENPDCEPLLSYEIERRIDSTPDGSIGTSFGENQRTFAGLLNGRDYQFRIRAQNRRDWGPFSEWSTVVTPCDVPGPGPALTLTRDDGAALVALAGEADPRGCVVTGYTLDIAGVGTLPLPTDGRIASLTNGQEYMVRVRATNDEGDGSWGPAASVTPAGRPFQGTVTAPEIGVNASGVPIMGWRIEFSAADGNGSPVTATSMNGSVQGFVSAGSSGAGDCVNAQGNQCLVAAPDTQAVATVSCLQRAQQVSVSATGQNDVGVSDPSSLQRTLEGCPDSTSSLAVTSVDTIGRSYQLSWITPAGATGVWLQVDGAPPEQWVRPESANSAILALPTDYSGPTVTLWACNPYGCELGNQVTVEVPIVAEALNGATVVCFETHEEVELGDNATEVFRLHGFFPGERVTATWDSEWPAGSNSSTSLADSAGIRLLKWECADDERNDPGQRTSPRSESISARGNDSGRTITVTVNQLPPS